MQPGVVPSLECNHALCLNIVMIITRFYFENRTVANGVDKEGLVPVLLKLGLSFTTELHHNVGSQGEYKPTNMPHLLVL
ncbi:hypothetical protein TSUD_94790 [Trifolium subterraneum]|uniref:Uncharacterized protein n=1 Tax=Trifolium subterraneum TaxID=3900 RepID=A0A2Z6PBK6_TRISU|nr:hypothetical protein TSUD_94790 [Trifolium subterraneum]